MDLFGNCKQTAENFKQTAENCKQTAENRKNLPLLKHILDLPMMGQICFFQELQLFEIPNFDLGHPV